MARHCSGGIVLGFSQFFAPSGEFKPGTPGARKVKNVMFPTPWNQLEAGILFGLRLPLMVFHEDGIEGGVFDRGVTDVFLNRLPLNGFSSVQKKQVTEAIQSWSAKVREHYRRWDQ